MTTYAFLWLFFKQIHTIVDMNIQNNVPPISNNIYSFGNVVFDSSVTVHKIVHQRSHFLASSNSAIKTF